MESQIHKKLELLIDSFRPDTTHFFKDQRLYLLQQHNAEFPQLQASDQQQVVSIILSSDLPRLVCNIWDGVELSPDFCDEVSSFIYSITVAVFQYEKELELRCESTKPLSNFFNELYNAALAVPNPQLAHIANTLISEKIISGLMASESLTNSFLEEYPDFPPYRFFITHCATHYLQISECINQSHKFPLLSKCLDREFSRLMSHLSWSMAHTLQSPGSSWKLQLIIEVSRNAEQNNLLQHFLKSVEPWSTFLEVSLLVVTEISYNSKAESIIGEAIQNRLECVLLKAEESETQGLTDGEIDFLLGFVGKVCVLNKVHLLQELFYIKDATEPDEVAKVLHRYRELCFGKMRDSESFTRSFTEKFPEYLKLARKAQFVTRLSAQNALTRFLLCQLKCLLTKPPQVGHNICNAVLQLHKINCSSNREFPTELMKEVSALIESVSAARYTKLRREMEKSEGSIFAAEGPGGESYTVLQTEAIKLHLLEKVAGATYASIKALELR